MAKTRIGTVVSDKMNQTAVVEVERFTVHPIYRKRYRVSKRFKAHNPQNQYKQGDKVTIRETRPISKETNWLIINKIGEEITEAVATSEEQE